MPQPTVELCKPSTCPCREMGATANAHVHLVLEDMRGNMITSDTPITTPEHLYDELAGMIGEPEHDLLRSLCARTGSLLRAA